ncbi:hypothetical protein POM88_001708 [Heracleum sosnowskyi]|uniref:Legume lectin domain-containing protein n=1 Tax=Heracleum sosnowskyi TaxID=360622 RepID=A0AAD8JFF7_9APIA|nr:hypothetical protein POM88_001708 [Heracleum sosnowskyi]
MMLCNFWNIFDLHEFKIQHRIFFIFILHFFIFSCDVQLSFNYITFSPNTKGIIYEGDATPSDPVIQLTFNHNDEGMNNSSGLAMYNETLQLWDKVSGTVQTFLLIFHS